MVPQHLMSDFQLITHSVLPQLNAGKAQQRVERSMGLAGKPIVASLPQSLSQLLGQQGVPGSSGQGEEEGGGVEEDDCAGCEEDFAQEQYVQQLQKLEWEEGEWLEEQGPGEGAGYSEALDGMRSQLGGGVDQPVLGASSTSSSSRHQKGSKPVGYACQISGPASEKQHRNSPAANVAPQSPTVFSVPHGFAPSMLTSGSSRLSSFTGVCNRSSSSSSSRGGASAISPKDLHAVMRSPSYSLSGEKVQEQLQLALEAGSRVKARSSTMALGGWMSTRISDEITSIISSSSSSST